MRIAVVGNGIVGGALRLWFETHLPEVSIGIWDPPQGKKDPIDESVEVAFISVPVPTKGFKQDLTILHSAIQASMLAKYIVIRSSVVPGTCDTLSSIYGRAIIAMPEFLTERTAFQDFCNQDVIIGYPDQFKVDANWWVPFVSIFGNLKRIRWASAMECELAKYAHNSFGAFKVTYFNMVYHLCTEHGLQFERVREMVLASGYINETHTHVPGPDGRLGYGGKCFPKDLSAFIGFVNDNPAHVLLKDVLCLNRLYRGPDPEIELKNTPTREPNLTNQEVSGGG
ncbi:MAG: hypothetical protein C4586_05855 [Anaerolineaceae bacterium]|nr:MAG: hypothetical protein C4586_05855 [Anaerolineaceae bacterium]